MMNYFDLEKAQQGHPLITRDGRDATYITYAEGATAPVVVLVGTTVMTYSLNGKFFKNYPSDLDLFMKVDNLFESAPVSFPEPLREAPEEGTLCYAVSLLSDFKWSVVKWTNDPYCTNILEAGLLHKTKENAILHANALIKTSGGKT